VDAAAIAAVSELVAREQKVQAYSHHIAGLEAVMVEALNNEDDLELVERKKAW
jgi:hypothetical protein